MPVPAFDNHKFLTLKGRRIISSAGGVMKLTHRDRRSGVIARRLMLSGSGFNFQWVAPRGYHPQAGNQRGAGQRAMWVTMQVRRSTHPSQRSRRNHDNLM